MTRFLPAEGGEAASRLDRFELIAELASGGMATVYLARLGGVAGFQRLVAIKRLHPHLARDPEFTQMFLDEARLAARLHHPHVVPILEIGESPTGYYLVMEYIEGDTLARLLARSSQGSRAFPPKVAVRIMLDVLAGLHAAHELVDDEGKPLHIVHRDVSPQNVLCGVDGSSRLTDFGVARAASRLTTTRSGQLKGKLAYMAPEQAKGTGIDRRADVFAAGICLWEALALRRLFKGEGDAETLNKVVYEPIPLLRAGNPEAHPAFEAVCAKALDRDPEKRYPTASALADALEDAAREAGALGTGRDVAAHLEAVLGSDISQQREAVRAWLARSEPSRRSLPSPLSSADAVAPAAPSSAPSSPSRPSDVASATKIEARGSQSKKSSLPPPPSGGPKDMALSSVSSAVIAVPMPGQAPAVATPSEPPRSRRVWPVALVVVGVVLGGAFGWWRVAATSATATAPATPTATPTATATGTATATATQAAAGIDAGAKPAARMRRRTGPTAPTSTVPDDISHNPYR